MNRSQGPPQTSYGGYNGSRDGRSQGGLSTQSISYGDEKASQANQSFQQQRYSQASKQGLQRGSVGQAPGGSLGPEQARPGQPSKSREDEERRQNIMCFLFLTLGLLAAVIVVMVVLLAVWLTDGDDEVTVLVNATNETESRTQSTNPDPVPADAQWTVRDGNTFQSDLEPDVGYATAVAIAGDLVVVGASQSGKSIGRSENSVGLVETYQRSNVAARFSQDTVTEQSEAEEFGASLAMTVTSNNVQRLCVGAPRTLGIAGIAERTVSFGTAYCYSYTGSSWEQIGDALRPDEDLTEAGGLFGYDVAVASSADVAAASSPSSSRSLDALNTGNVYTFELRGNSWLPMTPTPLRGDTPEGYFGQSIDMSQDGSQLLVGAPGSPTSPLDGEVFYYRFDGSWNQIFESAGTNREAHGTAVAIISPNGDQFAIGSPEHNRGRGRVQVFGFNTTSSQFEQLGDDIVGISTNENVGSTLDGMNGRVVVGTRTGFLRSYDYDGTSWNRVGDSPNVGAPIVSIAMDMNQVAVGMGDESFLVLDLTE